LIEFCDVNSNTAFISLCPFLPYAAIHYVETSRIREAMRGLPQPRWVPDGSGQAGAEKAPENPGKRGKESELAWMGLALIVSTTSDHPALRQRILWELGAVACTCFICLLLGGTKAPRNPKALMWNKMRFVFEGFWHESLIRF